MTSPAVGPTVSPAQLAQLVDQAPISMCVVAVPSLEILVANREFLALAGVAAGTSAPIGDLAAQQPPGSLPRGLLPILRQVVFSGGDFAKEEVRVLQGERESVFEVTAVPMRRPDGSLWAIMTMVVDVTERRRAEAEALEERQAAGEAYARETRIADRFQSALLPRGAIQVPGYAIAHTYRPALTEAAVGGDFYNFLWLDEHHLAIVIGDVGGKGLEAGVVAARVQHAIIALALNGRRDPGTVLAGVRRVVNALEEPEQLVTVFVGILDWTTGHLRYASAGHDPAFLWQAAAQRVKLLGSNGPAIVAVAMGDYLAHEVRLAEGDLLFLYTDGLPEAHPQRRTDLLGIEKVADLVAQYHGEEPASLIEQMYQAALRHSEGYLRDDIVLIAMRCLRAGQPPFETTFVAPPTMGQRLSPRPAKRPPRGRPGSHRAE